MMLLAEHSSEFERIWAKGRSVCTTTFGLRGSETSTPVKFFGALSCASQMMRRPSLAMVIDMPSPMPPKPPRSLWASSLKFQVIGSPVWVSGLLAAAIGVSIFFNFPPRRFGGEGQFASCPQCELGWGVWAESGGEQSKSQMTFARRWYSFQR